MFSCIYVYFCTLLLVVFFFRGLGYEAEIFVRKEKKEKMDASMNEQGVLEEG